MRPELEELLRADRRIWRGHGGNGRFPVLATGFAELDRILPGGGWPLSAITEIRVSDWGIGELRLLLPAMCALVRQGRWLVWIAPPFQPYAPALCQNGLDLRRVLIVRPRDADADLWWSMEKLLRHPSAGLVMAWPSRIHAARVRRVQLAAEDGGTMGVLFHRERSDSTPAALRMALDPDRDGALLVRLLKARGGFGGAAATVPLLGKGIDQADRMV
ncbi:MAG: translesion DNA synthesis-associated protein ImuA [Methylotetracoccus sp.]